MITLDIRNDGTGDTPAQVISRIQGGRLLDQAIDPATRSQVEGWYAACCEASAPFLLNPERPNPWTPEERAQWHVAASQIAGVLGVTTAAHEKRKVVDGHAGPGNVRPYDQAHTGAQEPQC